jgi:hypothetical protein
MTKRTAFSALSLLYLLLAACEATPLEPTNATAAAIRPLAEVPVPQAARCTSSAAAPAKMDLRVQVDPGQRADAAIKSARKPGIRDVRPLPPQSDAEHARVVAKQAEFAARASRLTPGFSADGRDYDQRLSDLKSEVFK